MTDSFVVYIAAETESESEPNRSRAEIAEALAKKKGPQAPRLGPHHSGPRARSTRPRAASAARRVLAGSARVSVGELELGNTTCPPCPQKGKVAIFPSRR